MVRWRSGVWAALVEGERDGDDGLLVVDGAGPDCPSWWRRVAGAREDQAGGWALDDSQGSAHACVGAIVSRCFVALGRLALQNATVGSTCDGSSSTSQTATRRVGLASAAVPCWTPWTSCLTHGHCCAGVSNQRLVPAGSSSTEGLFIKTADEFSYRRVPISLSSLPKHVFFSHYFTPSFLSSSQFRSLMQTQEFQHILRILNTNVEGKRNVVFALTKIKGLGRRFADIICKKAEIDVNKRAGELTADEIEKLVAIIQNPRQFKVPLWFLNRQKDWKTGKYSQVFAQNFDAKLRDDVERLKKIRAHRGLRHWWGIRVRGQHTCSTGRRR